MASSVTRPQVSREQLVLTTSCFIWARVPLCLIGPPGATKSSTVRAIAAAFGWLYQRKPLPGVTDPVLLSGLPGQDETNTRTKPYPWLQALLDETAAKKRSILCFEDAGEVSRAIQTALLETLGDNELGGHALPLTSMVATANPIGGGLQVTAAMANRIGHLRFTITPKEHAALMRRDFPNPEIPNFREDDGALVTLERGTIAAFLDTLQDFDAPDPDQQQPGQVVGPYPSARTWDFTARVFAAVAASDLLEEQKREVRILASKSLVGDVAANAYFTWVQYPDMLRPADVVGNPNLVREKRELFTPDKIDKAFIFLGALTRYVLATNTVPAWRAAWQVLGTFASQKCVPICAPYALILQRRRPKDAPDTTPEMAAFSEVFGR